MTKPSRPSCSRPLPLPRATGASRARRGRHVLVEKRSARCRRGARLVAATGGGPASQSWWGHTFPVLTAGDAACAVTCAKGSWARSQYLYSQRLSLGKDQERLQRRYEPRAARRLHHAPPPRRGAERGVGARLLLHPAPRSRTCASPVWRSRRSGRQPPCQLDRPSQDAPHDGGGRPEDGDLQRCVGRSEDLAVRRRLSLGRTTRRWATTQPWASSNGAPAPATS